MRRLAPILAVLAGATLPAGAADTIELGPAPITNGNYVGRIAAVACSPTNFQVYYVGAADGGVWKTTDAGQSWLPLTDTLPTQAIGALAIDPTNDQVIYAGTGEANYANHSRYGLGLYKSTDGGATWQHLAADVFAGRTFAKLVIDPASPQTLYAAIGRAGGFPERAAARNHPQADGPAGIFRSTDGGVTWTHLAGGLPTDLAGSDVAIDVNNPQVLYACIGRIFGADGNGIYKSTDGGDSWTRLSEGLPANWGAQGRISVAVAPSDSNRVYAMITRRCDENGGGASMRGAYRSDDAGATWTTLPLENIQASYGWYLSIIQVDPEDADEVYFGGLSVQRSLDGGSTWTNVTTPHVDIHAFAWTANGHLLCGNDGGLHRSRSQGDRWQALNEGLGTIQFYAGLSTHPDNPEVFFGGTQDNGSNLRQASGITWRQVLGGDGGWTQINQDNPGFVYAEFQGTGNLYRSTTGGGGGYNLSNIGINGGDRNCFLPPYVIDPGDPTRMLYGTHRVFESTNRGASWTRITGDLTKGDGAIRCLAIAPSDSSYVYAVTNDGNVQVSSDRGDNFTLVLEDHPGWPRTTRELVIDPHDPQTAYLAAAAFGVTQIQRTRDAGQTWQPLDQNFPDIPVNTLAVDPRSAQAVIYAGSDQGLFRSVDDGGTWHRFGRDLPHATVIDLLAEPHRTRLVVGTQGRGAWDIAASLPGDVDLDNDVDLTDLAILLAALPCDGPDCPVDVNGDGRTDLDDLQRLLIDFGL